MPATRTVDDYIAGFPPDVADRLSRIRSIILEAVRRQTGAEPEEKMRYGAEYNGAEHHTSTADAAYDARRGEWLDARGWEIDDFTSASIYGLSPHPSEVLLSGWDRARARHGLRRR